MAGPFGDVLKELLRIVCEHKVSVRAELGGMVCSECERPNSV